MKYNTYWNNKGLHQQFVTRLNRLIPSSGPVHQPRKNRALEKFRKASNCYQDLFNNGLGNRAQQFYGVFGFASSHFKRHNYRGSSFSPSFYDKVEAIMDDIVLAAAKEQGVFEAVAQEQHEEAQCILGHS